jgi:tetratricopeptide (TPR) repeat protein
MVDKLAIGVAFSCVSVLGLIGVFGLVGSSSANAQSVPGCGRLENAYGPYDYTNPDDFKNKLPIVESHHFQPEVERLEIDERGRPPGGGLQYTLRAFPNHHRALQAIARLELLTKQSPVERSPYTAECWFRRAIAFKPDDGVVRMLFGVFLQKKGKLDEALEQYKVAEGLLGDNPDLSYNLGLLYYARKEYQLAYEYASKAYDAGFPLPGLKQMLRESGHWKDE